MMAPCTANATPGWTVANIGKPTAAAQRSRRMSVVDKNDMVAKNSIFLETVGVPTRHASARTIDTRLHPRLRRNLIALRVPERFRSTWELETRAGSTRQRVVPLKIFD